MPTTSNEIGDRAEELLRAFMQGERIKQSGGGRFWKSDVRDRLRIIWEVKGFSRGGFRVTRDILAKSRMAARGVMGSGDLCIPAVAVVDDETNRVYALIDLVDLVPLLMADPALSPRLVPSKAKERIAGTHRGL